MNKQNRPGRPKFNPVIPKGNFTMKQFCEANGVDVSGTPKSNKNWGKGEKNCGKGETCIRLTLVKCLKRERQNRKTGLITRLDKTAKVPADGGLGAPQWVYCARNEADCGVAAAKARRTLAEANRNTLAKATTPTPTPRKVRKGKATPVVKAKRKYTRKSNVATPETPAVTATGLSQATQTFEDIKQILATPEPTAPVAETPAPITAPVTVPVAEIPAPAPVDTAPEVALVVAPVTETPVPVAA